MQTALVLVCVLVQTLDKSQGAPFKKKAKPNSAASVHTGKPQIHLRPCT
jgi:hypothetical protein